jgi:hypothetical protein
MYFIRLQVMDAPPDASSRERARLPRTILDGSSVPRGGMRPTCSRRGAPGRTVVLLLPVTEPAPTHSPSCREEAGMYAPPLDDRAPPRAAFPGRERKRPVVAPALVLAARIRGVSLRMVAQRLR